MHANDSETDCDDRHDEDDAAAVIAALGAGPAVRLELLCDVRSGLRPRTPHHELGHLGVHPDHQGRGVARALLRHHHVHLDAAGIPAYTVATSRNVRDFYGRHGYAVRERATVPGGPILWAMFRPPITDQTHHAGVAPPPGRAASAMISGSAGQPLPHSPHRPPPTLLADGAV
jgi:hypothetical protein